MKISVPALSLVVLIGPSGSGKSTFARRHFLPTEIISSDHCRALVCDDENDQSATQAAFEIVHAIADRRLSAGRLAVIDATSVEPESRASLIALAKRQHVFAAAIVFDVSTRECIARNEQRADRRLPAGVIQRQQAAMRRSMSKLKDEGFRYVYRLSGDVLGADGAEGGADGVTLERVRLWTDRRDDCGPFDIIGDVHGCAQELESLLDALGYTPADPASGAGRRHPGGRRAIFVGDLVDRGPDAPGALRRVMEMTAAGAALCVPGNHEVRLVRRLSGRDVKLTHGLKETMEQLSAEPPGFCNDVKNFLDGLISHMVLDGGKLVVAHAGLPEAMHGRSSAAVREFALYGETTGETDSYGLPVRYAWAADYRGRALVVYGHTPVREALWENNTVCIDTGCVFGGKLTALRWPEKEILSVPAVREWYAPIRPLAEPDRGASDPEPAAEPGADSGSPISGSPISGSPISGPDAGAAISGLIDVEELLSRFRVQTEDGAVITISAENAAAALEAGMRFGVDPRWLIYLPPTMSPCETVPGGIGPDGAGWLERPEQAIAHYREAGVERLVCEQKHMGSRAVAIVCRDEAAARARFGVPALGCVYTRTGRPFFSDAAMERALLSRLSIALTRAGTWDRLQTGWVCLDAELMPWSVKAQSLIREQYAPVGAAAAAHLSAAAAALSAAAARTQAPDLAGGAAAHLGRLRDRQAAVADYNRAWSRYCWPVSSIDDLRFAPFHLLASEGHMWMDTDHGWHLAELARLAGHDPILLATAHRTIELGDPASEAAAIAWWERITAEGQEGMVVKPWGFTVRGRRGILQPAVKCRGRDYLRIIYGPEYTLPDQLPRLLSRGLGGKRSLAMREFLLGREGLRRFVRGGSLREVYQCSFGVLALESEPVDPRL